MGYIDIKRKLFDEIGVSQVLDSNLPKIPRIDSFESVKSKSFDLLPLFVDLLTTLVGQEKIKEILVNMIVNGTVVLDRAVKEALISYLSKKINFTIPENTSFPIPIKSIDFFELFKSNANSIGGNLQFSNNSLNGFIGDRLQNNNTADWNGLFTITPENDKLTIKIEQSRTSTEFIRLFVNALSIVADKQTVVNLVDYLYGTISSYINKSENSIEQQEKLRIYNNKIISSNSDLITFDDSFYEFSNDELNTINNNVNLRSRGVQRNDLVCGYIDTSISINILEEFYKSDNTTPQARYVSVTDTFNKLTNSITINNNDVDKQSVINNFFTELLKLIRDVIMSMILSPENVLLVETIKNLTNPQNLTSNNLEGFVKNNKQFHQTMVNEVQSTILSLLYPLIKKEINDIVSGSTDKIIKEKVKLYLDSLSSLTQLNKIRL